MHRIRASVRSSLVDARRGMRDWLTWVRDGVDPDEPPPVQVGPLARLSLPFLCANNPLGRTNPLVKTVSTAAGISAETPCQTAPVNWAILKIVGLRVSSHAKKPSTVGLVKDMRIGGSSNLFLSEDESPMSEYDTEQEPRNLRAYPYLISPNTATVTTAISASAPGRKLFSTCMLVVDVIRDDAFGPGLPGAYAR